MQQKHKRLTRKLFSTEITSIIVVSLGHFLSLISINSQIALLKEELHTSNDGLRVEIAVESFIEASLEVEEEKHHFASL